MDRYEFNTASKAEEFALSHFSKFFSGAEADLIEVVQGTQFIEKERLSVPEGGSPMMIERFRYVIRKDDLRLIDAILDGIKVAAPVGFFGASGISGTAEMAAVIGLIIAGFKICRDAIFNGKVLDPITYAVLYQLKNKGPLLEADLLSQLREKKTEWTDEIIHDALETLKSLPMKSGLFRELVKQDSQGFWHAVGV